MNHLTKIWDIFGTGLPQGSQANTQKAAVYARAWPRDPQAVREDG